MTGGTERHTETHSWREIHLICTWWEKVGRRSSERGSRISKLVRKKELWFKNKTVGCEMRRREWKLMTFYLIWGTHTHMYYDCDWIQLVFVVVWRSCQSKLIRVPLFSFESRLRHHIHNIHMCVFTWCVPDTCIIRSVCLEEEGRQRKGTYKHTSNHSCVRSSNVPSLEPRQVKYKHQQQAFNSKKAALLLSVDQKRLSDMKRISWTGFLS